MEMTTVTIHDQERRLADRLNRTYVQFNEPNNLTEMNNIEITPIFFHRPSVTSTYDTSESIATLPPESDLDDGTCWLHHCTYKREKRVQTDHMFCHSYRENSVSSSSRFRASAGRPAAVFSNNESRVKNLTPTGTVFPLHIEQFKEKMKHYPHSLNRKVIRDLFLKSKDITHSQRQDLKH